MATFHNKTILQKFLLEHFDASSFDALSKDLKHEHLEGYNQEGNTHYLDVLKNKLFENQKLTNEMLQEYDERIVRFTHEISKNRTEIIKWKYFQYLSLLFTEVYLDRYFSNQTKLLNQLNNFVSDFNNRFEDKFKRLNPDKFIVDRYDESDLNKIAFWNATGSGKTLLMHVNIKQYLYHAKKHNSDFNEIILITPIRGLTNQHLEEFKLSDIEASTFTKSHGNIFSGTNIEVIEITKLAEESGDETVAVDAFETNNLVLIDEGHRGASGETWKKFRDRLSETGFAFEYSATFGQAIAAATGKNRKELEQEYAKSIIFDYSYKFFYSDGYGKEYKILNINNDDNKQFVRRYLTANLLSYYQQLIIYGGNPNIANQFLLHKPLLVFVGGRVNAVREVNRKDTSDVLDVIYFLREFIKEEEQSKVEISSILSGDAGLLDAKDNSIFYNSFSYLVKEDVSASEIYRDLLKRVFNSDVPRANLYLDNLKGADGELGLRIGDAKYFAVINVGDEDKLFKLAQCNQVLGSSKEFSESLFNGINDDDSTINLLIGSKKFTEGWSSWRVSSMGLLNIGKNEGSQIIQLFGRGVRLKGLEFSLKRSSALSQYKKPKNYRNIKKIIAQIETLNIFGVKANYMQKFKEFLEEEGLPKNDSNWQKISIPAKVNNTMLENNLKLIQVKEGENFKSKIKLNLQYDSLVMSNGLIELDWYPKIQVLVDSNARVVQQANRREQSLAEHNFAFADWNKIYFALQNFKFEKHWYNLSIELSSLKNIIKRNDWYRLLIPSRELEFKSLKQVVIWEEIIISLLKKYIERYYNYNKNLFDSERIETKTLSETDENLLHEYELNLNTNEDTKTIQDRVDKLITSINDNTFENETRLAESFVAFDNEFHVYKPLISLDVNKYKEAVKVSPIALDDSEKRFADDLVSHYQSNREKLKNQKVYLLRNQSKKGIGFFIDTNNFYPDFILWIIIDGKQHVAFIDPKGIRNSKGMSDPKIQFHNYLKNQIEPQLNSDEISLNSFIISNTRFLEVNWREQLTIDDFHDNNVYFQLEDNNTYIGNIVNKTINS